MLHYDFRPGKDYLFAAQPLDKAIYSKVSYPKEPRERFAALVAAAGIVPAVKTSDPLVEAQIVESPHGRLLVISNWRCEPSELRLTYADGVTETRTLAPFETIEINPKGERKTK